MGKKSKKRRIDSDDEDDEQPMAPDNGPCEKVQNPDDSKPSGSKIEDSHLDTKSETVTPPPKRKTARKSVVGPSSKKIKNEKDERSPQQVPCTSASVSPSCKESP